MSFIIQNVLGFDIAGLHCVINTRIKENRLTVAIFCSDIPEKISVSKKNIKDIILRMLTLFKNRNKMIHVLVVGLF